MEQKTRVLFVCLGNICRSPLARALFEQQVNALGLDHKFHIDSAGTSSNHVGEDADARTKSNAKQNGLTFSHRARQFNKADFDRFDRIIVMDQSNRRDVVALAADKAHEDKVYLMRHWDRNQPGENVPDPWYGGSEGFEAVYQLLKHCTGNLLADLK